MLQFLYKVKCGLFFCVSKVGHKTFIFSILNINSMIACFTEYYTVTVKHVFNLSLIHICLYTASALYHSLSRLQMGRRTNFNDFYGSRCQYDVINIKLQV